MASKIFQKKGQRKELTKVTDKINSDDCVSALVIAVTIKDVESGQLNIDIFNGGDRRIVLQAMTSVMHKLVGDICAITGLKVLEEEAKESNDCIKCGKGNGEGVIDSTGVCQRCSENKGGSHIPTLFTGGKN